MIVYLIKSGLCLALLLVTYHLFLEREKIHQFNRFFLLFALIFGLTIPVIQVGVSSFDEIKYSSLDALITPAFVEQIPALNDRSTIMAPDLLNQETSSSISNAAIAKSANTSSFNTTDLLITFYLIGVLIFAIRFLKSLSCVLQNRMKSEISAYGRTTLVLMDDDIMPHSFMNWIFLSKKAFHDKQIEDQVFEHELAHIRGKHSWDVLFVEMLKIFFWFNPVFYFYKKAIQLNHEFIADQVVSDSSKTLRSYQQLLMKYAGIHIDISLTSNLSFHHTKRRLMMINQEKHVIRAILKRIFLVPIIVLAVLFFSEPTIADTNPAINFDSEIITLDSIYSGSPYYNQFANRLSTYQDVYNEYETGNKTKRDVLYQRIRLVWLHQRLTPEEQKTFKVPDLPMNFADDVPLTEEERRYQQKYNEYIAYRESLDELPNTFDHELYEKFKELITLYNGLDIHIQIFVAENLPNKFLRHINILENEKKVSERSLPPMHMIISNLNKDLAIHYLNEHGNTVSTTVGELSEEEIEYLLENTRKSYATQVYPLPVEQKPTDQEIEKWQDDYYYQIWLDGEVIGNKELMEMNMENIHHFRIHEVRWNANRRVPYDYQVLMYTHEAFEEMVEKYRPSKGMIPIHKAILLR